MQLYTLTKTGQGHIKCLKSLPTHLGLYNIHTLQLSTYEPSKSYPRLHIALYPTICQQSAEDLLRHAQHCFQ